MGPIPLFLAVLLAVQQAAAIPTAWRMERRDDPATAARSCALVSGFRAVTARLTRASRAEPAAWSVTVGFDNQPGSLRYIRINRAIYTTDRERFSGDEAAAIVGHMKGPGEFAFEWAKRPDSAKQAGLFGTGDFAAKAAQCERWIQGPRV